MNIQFTLRELSRVFQGILRTPRVSITDSKTLIQLWRHENERVFADKLTTLIDKNLFLEQLEICTAELIELSILSRPVTTSHAQNISNTTNSTTTTAKDSKYNKNNKNKNNIKITKNDNNNDLCTYEQIKNTDIYFVDFLKESEYDEDGVLISEAPKIYEYGGILDNLRNKVQSYIIKYNEQYSSKAMKLILFDDALKHILRITRILGINKGNILLVGVGGSGKQSLTKISSYISNQTCFQITITKSYNLNSLLDDIRILYRLCGSKNEKITFLLTDSEIKDESFLEIINAILTTGEIANLFPKDELIVMASELRNIAIKTIPNFIENIDNLCKFFYERVKNNLHLVLCMSPVNNKFAERARRFPGIFSGCTINWFLTWPKEALIAVSEVYLNNINIDCNMEIKKELIQYMGITHQTVIDFCEEYYIKMRRKVYHTPTSFLQFLNNYCNMYNKKSNEIIIKANRVEIGLEKLFLGSKDVEKMKIILAEEEIKLKLSEEATNIMLSKLETKLYIKN